MSLFEFKVTKNAATKTFFPIHEYTTIYKKNIFKINIFLEKYEKKLLINYIQLYSLKIFFLSCSICLWHHYPYL